MLIPIFFWYNNADIQFNLGFLIGVSFLHPLRNFQAGYSIR